MRYKSRRKVSRKRSKRMFSRTAIRTKTRNYRGSSMRGGYRL